MATMMIGVDPHKASHTAVAVGADEEPLDEVRVCASAVQAERLLEWAAAWPERVWAFGGADGIGHLLAQQLLAAGGRCAWRACLIPGPCRRSRLFRATPRRSPGKLARR
jgi:hypothetical protein